MKTVRSFIVFLFVFLASISIFFDANDLSYLQINSTHSEKQHLDIFEENCTVNFSISKGVKKAILSYNTSLIEIYSPSFGFTSQLSKGVDKLFNYACKLRSYLHLLQLF